MTESDQNSQRHSLHSRNHRHLESLKDEVSALKRDIKHSDRDCAINQTGRNLATCQSASRRTASRQVNKDGAGDSRQYIKENDSKTSRDRNMKRDKHAGEKKLQDRCDDLYWLRLCSLRTTRARARP